MSVIRSLIRKILTVGRLNVQVLIVWVAFAMMVFASYFFVGNIVRKHLMYETMAALNFIEVKIEADLMEPQTLMGSIAETVRSIIMRENDIDRLTLYMKDISDNVIRNKNRKLNSTGVYGLFEIYGNKFIDLEWMPPEDYEPQTRPWYKTAVEAEGKVAITSPYLDIRNRSLTVAYVMRIFDDNNNPLAVLGMNVPINEISEYIVETRLAEGGYGLLLNENLEVIAHPDKEGLGRHLREWYSGLAGLADELEGGKKSIPERRLINYKGDVSIVSFRRLDIGWYIGIVTPYNKYYQDVYNMMIWFVALGLTLAVTLSVIFLRIAEAKAKADLKNQQKSNFLARMSHEIRTPMNAILGITEIQMQNEALPQDVIEAFAKINNSGDLLVGIINDILDLSKIEAGKLELTSAKYDVPSLLNDIVQLNVLYFDSKPIEFNLSVDENVPLTLIGDDLRIKQILNNLLSNAFKYTDKGEISLTVTADYTQQEEKTNILLVFRVSDTGQGMTAEQVRKLGDEYSRFNMEANRATTGTGLGMNITMKLIQMMNGGISVESKPGSGTTITVRLPQTIVDNGTIGREMAENLNKLRLGRAGQMKKTPQIVREYMPYGKVLVVDDVESNLYVAKGLMAPYGLTIETASSGLEAVDKIQGGAVFDIVFMDHFMPEMDGVETVKIMRGLGYTNPIVALTANALAGQSDLFIKSGFDGFISKPIDIRQLNASLNKFIRGRYPPEVIEAARKQAAWQQAAGNKPATAEDAKSAAGDVLSVSDPELMAIFIRDAEHALEKLDEIRSNAYGSTDDIRQYVVYIHAMKSALANINETELSAAAFKLEKAGRAEDLTVIKSETPAFLEALREVIRKSKPKEEARENLEYDRAYLSEKLAVIKKACEEYDEKTAYTALTELKQKNCRVLS